MKSLRRMIRKIILEVYDMTPEDELGLKQQGIEKGGMMDTVAKSHLKTNPDLYRVNITNMRRAKGLQYREEIETDREALQKLHSNPEYASMVKAFEVRGKTTSLYMANYHGTFTSRHKKMILDAEKWINTWGQKTNDSISTKSWIGELEDLPDKDVFRFLVLGFILEGYPVLVANSDAYSQTYSASPQGLKDHQKSSGFAKRGDTTTAFHSFEDWKLAGGMSHETILDNWEVIGVVVHEDHLDKVTGYDDLDIPVAIVDDRGVIEYI